MSFLKTFILLITIFASINCKPKSEKSTSINNTEEKLSLKSLQKYETAYFASGCFWCVEAIFESVKGVKEVISGYSGGIEENPTYEQVGYGRTTHAEAVVIYYDPKIISFKELVQVYYGSHNPTTKNGQGPDMGSQYRSIAFYKNNEEKKIIEDYITQLTKDKVFSAPIVTEIKPYIKFYKAEEYHQDYEKKHPNHPYIQSVSIPRLKRFQKKFPMLLKKEGH